MPKIWLYEQWMGWPVGRHHATLSNVDNAWRLHGELMLVVGVMSKLLMPARRTMWSTGLSKPVCN